MKNIREIEVEIAPDKTETYLIIDLGNNEFRSLPKVKWEAEQQAMQAEQSTPSVIDEAEAK
jgi:hypothetical protein